MSTVNRRTELVQELAKLDAEDIRKAALSPAQRVAEALHGRLCHYNHTDGCSWHYFSWSSRPPSSAHQDYLGKAEALLTAMKGNEQAILTVLEHL